MPHFFGVETSRVRPEDVKSGGLIKTGDGFGIILQNKMKWEHQNFYARVYYFDSRYHSINPCWVFLECLTKMEGK